MARTDDVPTSMPISAGAPDRSPADPPDDWTLLTDGVAATDTETPPA